MEVMRGDWEGDDGVELKCDAEASGAEETVALMCAASWSCRDDAANSAARGKCQVVGGAGADG